jgi:SDR family mycofactocin-dependent oxidoreductase
MPGRVDGKVALVTGAARGQGRAFAVKLASEGADVIAVDIAGALPSVDYDSTTPADLAETLAQIEATGRRGASVRCDVRDLDRLVVAVEEQVAELGRLDVVVANAGICIPAPWDEVDPAAFDDTMAVNVRGTWNTVMAGVAHLIDAGGGSVILISSAAGLKVQPFLIPYTTSKWAVRGMAKAFAVELAAYGIRVNSIHQTAVRTGMATGGMEETMSRAVERMPRLGPMFTNLLDIAMLEPEDVAEAVLFLASDESKFITAHELAVDAGVSEF